MDKKPTDLHLRAMLNSPARMTPAVPTPDWGAPPQPPQIVVNNHDLTNYVYIKYLFTFRCQQIQKISPIWLLQPLVQQLGNQTRISHYSKFINAF